MSSQQVCELMKAEIGKGEIQAAEEVTSSYQPLLGQVVFDFGKISHTMFGQAHVKGNFSRLLPRVQRPLITDEDLKIMVDHLKTWANQYFSTELRPKYFEILIEAVCLYTYYTYPFPPIGSLRMNLTLELLLLLMILDDIIEPGPTAKSICEREALNNGLSILLGVFQNIHPNPAALDHFPLFSEIYRCAVDMNYSLCQHGYSTSLFCKLLEKYFDNIRRGAVTPINDTNSEEAFFAWRKADVFYDGNLEIYWFLEYEEKFPPTIFHSTSFQRMLDLNSGIISCTNDMLGLKKDLENGAINNFIIFKVCQKKIPMNSAIEQVCELLNNSLEEYLILKKEILIEFSNHPGLVNYIEILESATHEHVKFFFSARRYCAVGQVTIVDYCTNTQTY